MWKEGIAAVLFLAGALTLFGQDEEKRNPYTSAADEAAGSKIFRSHCAVCHGIDGKGGRGPDLTRGVFRHGSSDAALLRTISRGIPGTEMPGIFFSENQVWTVVTYVRSLTRRASTATLPGDSAAGEKIYWNQADCSRCHMINGLGGRIGPDLTDIGWFRTPRYLRTAIFDPNAEIPRGYRSVTIVPRQGRAVDGIRLNEDSYSIRILDLEGNLHSFWKEELAEVKKEKISWMPAYAGVFTEENLDDLVAYLYSLRPAVRVE